jgi:hypothetical protein
MSFIRFLKLVFPIPCIAGGIGMLLGGEHLAGQLTAVVGLVSLALCWDELCEIVKLADTDNVVDP